MRGERQAIAGADIGAGAGNRGPGAQTHCIAQMQAVQGSARRIMTAPYYCELRDIEEDTLIELERDPRKVGPVLGRLEQLRAQRMQGDPTEQEALLSVAQAIADAQDTSSRGRGRGRGGKRASKKAKGAESPPPAGVRHLRSGLRSTATLAQNAQKLQRHSRTASP